MSTDQKEVKSIEQCHAEYAKWFVGTDFGSTDYPKLVRDGLQKVACGWANGRTMEVILLSAGLIEKRRDNLVLTDEGLAEMYALNSMEQTVLVAEALATMKQQDSTIASLCAKVEELEGNLQRAEHFRKLIEERNFYLTKEFIAKGYAINALKAISKKDDKPMSEQSELWVRTVVWSKDGETGVISQPELMFTDDSNRGDFCTDVVQKPDYDKLHERVKELEKGSYRDLLSALDKSNQNNEEKDAEIQRLRESLDDVLRILKIEKYPTDGAVFRNAYKALQKGEG